MRYHLGSHILPGLGDTQLTSINLETVQTWVTKLELAPASTARVITTLKAVWNTAREWGYVSHDLKGSERLRLPSSSPRRSRPILEVEEVKTLFEMAPEPLHTVLRTAYETGLRIGEVLWLQAEDVDARAKVLWVRQSVWHSQIQTPKTENSIRALAISDGLVTALAGPKGLLFHTRSGKPYGQRNMLREWYKLLKHAGFPLCGFHSLRHGNASWMARNGVPVRVAQERLSHADPRLTLKIYQHVRLEDGRPAAEELGRILDSTISTGNPIQPNGVNSNENRKFVVPFWPQIKSKAS